MVEQVQDRLVNRSRAGDADAFGSLVRQYAGRAIGTATLMLGSHHDALDASQEAFVRAWRKIDRFRGDGSFQSWLFKIASSACLKKRRRRKHEPAREESLDQLVEGREDRVPAGTAGGADEPAGEAEAAELSRRLQEALLSLPPIYRVVITLRDFQGLSTDETARALGISNTAAKVRLHRARTMIQKQVACYDADKVVKDCD